MSRLSRPLHIQTPLLESTCLGQALSNERGVKTEVWVKMDALQPSGSFKIRGIGHHATRLVEAGATRLITSSGGNAGLAVSVVGRKLKVPVEVVVPSTTPETMRKLILSEGAKVEVCGKAWDEANEEAMRRVKAAGGKAALVHPFDHPDLWNGHATIITEVHNQLHDEYPRGTKPKCIITVAGGGGLLIGILYGLSKVGWEDVPVVVSETKGADSLHQALEKRELITLPAITSIARSLGARRVAKEAFDLSLSRPVISLVVSDADAINACWTFLETHRVALEPSCGAGLALLYNWRAMGIDEKLAKLPKKSQIDGPVIFIACGGNMALEPRPKL